MCTIIIPYKKIDLTKATKWGLDFLLECLIEQESYEWAAEVRNEIEKRKLNSWQAERGNDY